MKRKVLITGAAGRIGSFITAQWVDRYFASVGRITNKSWLGAAFQRGG